MTLEDYIREDLGIAGSPVTSRRTKLFFPCKPKSCYNCQFLDIDNYSLEPQGCYNGFKTSIDLTKFNTDIKHSCKPLEKCYPVRDNSHCASLHADQVGVKIAELRSNRRCI